MVSGFASTPYNIAVGGTDFYGLYGNFAQYVGTSQGSSQTFYRTAFEYIPESTWNDSTGTNGPLADNSPEILNNGRTDIVSGGGGASNCSTNKDTATQQGQFVLGTCTSGYAKPSWQGGAGVPNDGARDIPDVSLMAGNGLYGAAWLVCTDDTTENASMQIVTENCTNQPDGNFYYSGFGGTSTSAPSFAGILALVQQANGGSGASHRLGAEGAKKLYDLFNSPRATASAVFHDITVGNNSVYCISGTPNCSLATRRRPATIWRRDWAAWMRPT
jgi:subtilisin family serine protease